MWISGNCNSRFITRGICMKLALVVFLGACLVLTSCCGRGGCCNEAGCNARLNQQTSQLQQDE